MAEGEDERVEEALNVLVITTEQSSNMKKALKQKIFETVSTLRTLFVRMKDKDTKKTKEISKLTKQVGEIGAELKQCKERIKEVHRAPSMTGTIELEMVTAPSMDGTKVGGELQEVHGAPSKAGTTELNMGVTTPSMDRTTEGGVWRNKIQGGTSADQRLEPAGELARDGAINASNKERNYAAAVHAAKRETFKLTIKPKEDQTPEKIKQILKNKINPGEIKVGVNTFKTYNGGVIIATNSKEELEVLENEIQDKCGDELNVQVYSLRKPRVIILNVPEDISTANIEDSIIRQNPELNIQKGSITAKSTYETKRMHRNAVIEVGAEIRKILLNTKVRLGWQICRTDDYLTATRCFKCSKFNHRTQDCRGEVTCPLCAGSHNLKECKANPKTYKCNNCENFNRHNPTKKISVNHSALDRKCPSLHAVLERNRQNTAY
jgi:hypothetical protein